MSYLQFDKTRLINLEYSIPKEVLLSNQRGVYASSTIIGCNTRKYHGLLVAPVEEISGGGRHLFLANLHETVIQHGQEFNLGINRYPGEYYPKGHKYARWFELDPTWKIVYRVGGVVLQKEILLDPVESQVLIKYTLLEAHSPTHLRLKPFLAFRNIHSIGKVNMFANTKIDPVPNGILSRMYAHYPPLFMQLSRKSEFVQAPDWYYKNEYQKDKVRGYDYHEDLFVPGYFELLIRKDEPVIFSASLKQATGSQLSRKFNAIVEGVNIRESFKDMLESAANTFFLTYGQGKEVVNGYHWFGSWGRHTFIALPGLSLGLNWPDLFEEVMESMLKRFKNGRFPDHSPDRSNPSYRAADTSLWFIWAVLQFAEYVKDYKRVWTQYGKVISSILASFSDQLISGVTLSDEGLIYADEEGVALTWMDAIADGKPVTRRPGFAVEINALWYMALAFSCDAAKAAGDRKFLRSWEPWPERVGLAFQRIFCNPKKSYLADFVCQGRANWDVRPNQIFAAGMKYSPLEEEQKLAILEMVRQELVTPRGLRTLSPRHEDYAVTMDGGQRDRDLAYHQGTVWPWLLGTFAEGWLRLYGKSGAGYIKSLIAHFEEDMYEHGIGTISEVYDGSPPHHPRGAISFASSIAEILRIKKLLKTV